MYLRHSTVRKDGKTHTYWRLVRSVRRNGKVVQETVAHLGELDVEGRLSARRLAREITGRRGGAGRNERGGGGPGPICSSKRREPRRSSRFDWTRSAWSARVASGMFGCRSSCGALWAWRGCVGS